MQDLGDVLKEPVSDEPHTLFGRNTKHLFSTVNHNLHNVEIKMLFVTIDTTAKVLWGYAILRQRIQKTHADYGF